MMLWRGSTTGTRVRSKWVLLRPHNLEELCRTTSLSQSDFSPGQTDFTLAAIATIIRYLCTHFAMHFAYIEEFLCPPAYFEHPISHAFCDLASAKAVSPRMRMVVANAIARVLRTIFSPGLKQPLMRLINSFAIIAYSKNTGSPMAFDA